MDEHFCKVSKGVRLSVATGIEEEFFFWFCCVCNHTNDDSVRECKNCTHKRCDGIAKQFRTFPVKNGMAIYISIFAGAGATVVQTLDKLVGFRMPCNTLRKGSTIVKRSDEVWYFYTDDGDDGFEKACAFLLLRGWVGIHDASKNLPSF